MQKDVAQKLHETEFDSRRLSTASRFRIDWPVSALKGVTDYCIGRVRFRVQNAGMPNVSNARNAKQLYHSHKP